MVLACSCGIARGGRGGHFGSPKVCCTGRVMGGARTAGLPWWRCLCLGKDNPGSTIVPMWAEAKQRPGKSQAISLWRSSKVVGFFFFFFSPPLPPLLFSHFCILFLHPNPKYISESCSIKSLPTPAGSWVKGQKCPGGRGVCEEEPQPVLLLQPPPSSPRLPPSPHFPSLMIPNGQSVPSRERDALKHHCGWERSISFFFLKKDDNDNPWT